MKRFNNVAFILTDENTSLKLFKKLFDFFNNKLKPSLANSRKIIVVFYLPSFTTYCRSHFRIWNDRENISIKYVLNSLGDKRPLYSKAVYWKRNVTNIFLALLFAMR